MRTLDALRLAFALFTITTAVNLQAPYYTALAAHDGLGVTATSLAFAAYVAGILPVLILLGGLPDRVGRRALIVTALSLCGAATALTLIAPGVVSLGLARLLMGIAAALTSISAPAYMLSLFGATDSRRPTNWVTASTSLGFGWGAAMTSAFLLHEPSLTPPSLWLSLAMSGLALLLLLGLDDQTSEASRSVPMLRLPAYPPGSLPFGLSILLAWATVGLVIAILPDTLARHGLSDWSGFVTLGICSGGVLFQPLARRLTSVTSVRLGLLILPSAYALIAWGALAGSLGSVLVGALAASSACYGFIYLGGLSGVLDATENQQPRASAGFFLMAYIGFSLPVVATGALVDRLGHASALALFGMLLLASALAVHRRLGRQRLHAPRPA
ncbi:MFS transporter [Halomonas caseinilytica]|uniref:MFS transporter n=1 Tax=Halomonas caseinilytica TaxID=438744 RepID=UPI0007E55A60|nr:MFS transporter [Halomonas caseinilytica]SEM49441.1 Predicted arabinose efflux permease, MFS family [Halomonas caseinilytica]